MNTPIGPPPPYGAQQQEQHFQSPPGPPPTHRQHYPATPPAPQHFTAPHLVPYRSAPPPRQPNIYPPRSPQPPIQPQPFHHHPPPPGAPEPPFTITPHPTLTLHGPHTSSSLFSSGKSSTVTLAHNPSAPLLHVTTSKHSKPHLTITRAADTSVLATGTYSSLSGSCTLHFAPGAGGQQQQPDVKLSADQLSLSGTRKAAHWALGEVVWREKGLMGGGKELREAGGGRVLARYREDMGGLKGGGSLEVFVNGDEGVVDFVVASWIAMVKGEEREVKEVLKVLGDVM